MPLPTSAQDEMAVALARHNTNFHPELDFLRSVAVLVVVLDHTCLALHREFVFGISVGLLGLVGVVMFFVHTSLVLMWSLERRPYTLDFYVRRIFRIYPLAWLAIGAAYLTHAPVLGTGGTYFGYAPISNSNLLANLLLITNMSNSGRWHAVVHVLWTLPAEVEMYLLLPVIFAFTRRERSLWTVLLFWMLAGAVAHLTKSQVPSLLSTVPDFLGGVLAYVAYMRVRPKLPSWTFPVVLGGLTVVTALVYPVHQYVLWVFSLVLGLSLPLFRPFGRSVFTRACHLTATYSYGIYLGHPFALVLGVYLLRGHVGVPVQLGVEFLVIVMVSISTYHLLEKPMIDMGARVAGRLELRALRNNEAVRPGRL